MCLFHYVKFLAFLETSYIYTAVKFRRICRRSYDSLYFGFESRKCNSQFIINPVAIIYYIKFILRCTTDICIIRKYAFETFCDTDCHAVATDICLYTFYLKFRKCRFRSISGHTHFIKSAYNSGLTQKSRKLIIILIVRIIGLYAVPGISHLGYSADYVLRLIIVIICCLPYYIIPLGKTSEITQSRLTLKISLLRVLKSLYKVIHIDFAPRAGISLSVQHLNIIINGRAIS